jgi:GNAT superfamily N-acetyltransferase
MPVIIREPLPADRLQWEVLWAGYNGFYERKGPAAVPAEVTETLWQRIFDLGEPVHALVAELDGQVVGIVHYLFHRNTTMIRPVCYLQDLFTAPEARGRGAGRALIEAVYERARQVGSPRVYWHTHKTNATAMALYDQVADNSGFVVYRKSLA